MSRLESGYVQPKFDWCDVNELVYNVLDRLDDELPNHKVIVQRAEYLPLFKLDYGLTEQVIYNLVYNAAQHTPKGAKIEIAIEYKPEVDFDFHDSKSYTLVIRISDDGFGFPQQEIDKVFDKFYRLQHSKTGGTGLGLSIVKGFIEAQDGKITLKNKEHGGAEFTIMFPALVMQTKDIGNE